MEKGKSSTQWIEEGYNIFAFEGPEGIQVERLARIVSLNKSGFYHYFGDIDTFHQELFSNHKHKVDQYLSRLKEIKTVDPEYFELLIEYKVSLLFQVQLTRIKSNPEIVKLAEQIHQTQDSFLMPLWCSYLGVDGHSSLAMRDFDIVRHMVYSRMDFKKLDYKELQTLIGEARTVIRELTEKHGNTLKDD